MCVWVLEGVFVGGGVFWMNIVLGVLGLNGMFCELFLCSVFWSEMVVFGMDFFCLLGYCGVFVEDCKVFIKGDIVFVFDLFE